jgi:hypothetical protein
MKVITAIDEKQLLQILYDRHEFFSENPVSYQTGRLSGDAIEKIKEALGMEE